jgi:hypothetical protein
MSQKSERESNQDGRRQSGAVRLLGAVIAGAYLAGVAVFATPAAADEPYDPYGAWNGVKIYLSPATHSDAGSRGECKGRNENTMAYHMSWYATNGDYHRDVYSPTSEYRNLRARGYQTRIATGGTVSTAISNSNAWGANAHIPVHSNAQGGGCNVVTDPARNGTVVIYLTTNGSRLSTNMKDSVGPSSPGTRDYTCHNNDPCTSIKRLAELYDTNAVASYLESEYHTWDAGVDWLLKSYMYGWRIGNGVDLYFGYPRG